MKGKLKNCSVLKQSLLSFSEQKDIAGRQKSAFTNKIDLLLNICISFEYEITPCLKGFWLLLITVINCTLLNPPISIEFLNFPWNHNVITKCKKMKQINSMNFEFYSLLFLSPEKSALSDLRFSPVLFQVLKTLSRYLSFNSRSRKL